VKLAISAQGEGLNAQTDQRFGRCPYFVLVDSESGELLESVRNESAGAAGGAGPQSAQLLSHRGVEAVLTGNVGPKAAHALKAGRIKIYTGVEGSVGAAVQKFNENKLIAVSEATTSAHSGMQKGRQR